MDIKLNLSYCASIMLAQNYTGTIRLGLPSLQVAIVGSYNASSLVRVALIGMSLNKPHYMRSIVKSVFLLA